MESLGGEAWTQGVARRGRLRDGSLETAQTEIRGEASQIAGRHSSNHGAGKSGAIASAHDVVLQQ